MGLTQTELASKVGTHQSVLSAFERVDLRTGDSLYNSVLSLYTTAKESDKLFGVKKNDNIIMLNLNYVDGDLGRAFKRIAREKRLTISQMFEEMVSFYLNHEEYNK